MTSEIILLCKGGNNKKLSILDKIEIGELDFVAFLLSTNELIDEKQYHVFLGDYPCEITYLKTIGSEYIYNIEIDDINPQNTKYESNRLENTSFTIKGINIGLRKLLRIFSLNVGECTFRLFSKIKDETLAIVEIIPEKLTRKDIEIICQELMEKHFLFFKNQYSLTRLPTIDEQTRQVISILDLLSILREKLLEINTIKQAFIFNKFETVKKVEIVKDWNDNNTISENFSTWISQNTHYSYPTLSNDPEKLYISYKPIRFSHGLYETYKPSTETDENKIIHHLIDILLIYLNRLPHELDKIENQLTSDFAGKFKKIYIRYCRSKHFENYELLISLRLFFEKHIPIKKTSNYILPTAERISTKNHYAHVWKIYLLLNELLNSSNTYGNLSKVLKIKSLADLYEQYCFIKIVESIKDVFDSTLTINSELTQAKSEDGQIVIYYKRSELFLRTKSGSNGALEPDYIISFNVGDIVFLLILDAKYKPERTIIDRDTSDLTLKYLHGMIPINNKAKVLGLFLLFPKTEKNEGDGVLEYYQKNDYLSYLPLIGRVSLFPKRESKLNELFTQIKSSITHFKDPLSERIQ